MSSDPKEFLSQIFSMPYGDMIASVGEGVADAQRALDEGSLAATLDLYASEADAGSAQEILQAIGYQPQYYGLKNVKGHLKMAMSFQAEGSGARLYGTPINPVVTGKYNYDAKASSELTFEIVPIPPAEQIRRVPELKSKKLSEILKILERLGLSAIFKEPDGNEISDVDAHVDDTCQSTIPEISEAGRVVRIDQVLEVTLIPKTTS